MFFTYGKPLQVEKEPRKRERERERERPFRPPANIIHRSIHKNMRNYPIFYNRPQLGKNFMKTYPIFYNRQQVGKTFMKIYMYIFNNKQQLGNLL